MNRSTLGVVLLSLLLGGCAAGRIGTDGFMAAMVTKPDPDLPNVFVTDDGLVVVDQEPIRIRRGSGRVVIHWALQSGSAFTFPADGIVIVDPATNRPLQGADCAPHGESRRVFRCSFERPSGPARYKYTIKVSGAKSALDPWIYND